MYIDIESCANVPDPTMATFKETGPGTSIGAVRLCLDRAWHWCDVIGWNADGPCAARVTPIEESGDGPARLVHGGAQGVRLRRQDLADPWSEDNATQWGEPFLILRPEDQVR